VVAAHCVAHSPYGQTETAWAEGDYTFSDKGWGWYDTYFYTPPAEENNILYGTVYTLDSLIIYHIDINTGASQVILTEFVGNTAGTYDGAAYDNESGLIFFTNYQTNQLWANDLNGEEPSFCTGTLSGTSASGTFYDGAYYYINEDLNTINQVLFDDLWQIISEITLDTIPGLITITDIAMDPTGNFLYMTGTVNGNDSELIAWEPETGAFYTLSLDISGEMQIAFGNDGNLYGIAPLFSDDDGSGIYVIHLDEDTLMEIEAEAIVLIDDPFTDLTRGPTW
jgi:hypothetical protein